MKNGDMDRVVPLDQLDDFKVAEGDPDVRGWEVMASDGRKIGEVDELLIDTNAMKVRYLDVDVDDGLMAEPDRHVLVPIGYARLDREHDRVIVDNVSSTDLRSMPAYDHSPLTRDFESSVRDSFVGRPTGTTTGLAAGAAGLGAASTTRSTGAGTTGTTGASDDFYTHDSFDDNRFYGARRGLETEGEQRVTRSEEELAVGKREMEAGAVEINKRVETEHVRESVPLRHEEVEIERRPIGADLAASGRAVITDDEIRVPLHEEEVIVEKRVVPKEELVVRKQEVVENETVEADLRKERIDVDTEGTVRDGGMRADSTLRDDDLNRRGGI